MKTTATGTSTLRDFFLARPQRVEIADELHREELLTLAVRHNLHEVDQDDHARALADQGPDGLVGSRVLHLGHHGLAGHVGRHDVDRALAARAQDLAVQPLPAVGLDGRLLGKTLPLERQDQVAVQGE